MRNSFRFFAIALLLSTGFAQEQWTWTPQTGRFVNLKRMPKETPELQLEYARSLMLAGDERKALRETEKFVEYYGSDALAWRLWSAARDRVPVPSVLVEVPAETEETRRADS